eukprot:c10062_g1_i1.p1 GENE.c10062_g1_i1~~c10062_g1_i1.p1  ORF type:complete len:406 (-),score=61.21 c10062_g1_i1:234-1451(-)
MEGLFAVVWNTLHRTIQTNPNNASAVSRFDNIESIDTVRILTADIATTTNTNGPFFTSGCTHSHAHSHYGNSFSKAKSGQWTLTHVSAVFHSPIAICAEHLQNNTSPSLPISHSVSATLESLPDEILEMVMMFLPAASLASLGGACKRLHRLSLRDSFWMHLYERDKDTFSAAGNVVNPTVPEGSATGKPVHAMMTWRQRYFACARYPTLNFQVTPHRQTVLETLMNSRKVDRVALFGCQGSHKQKILGFLLSNPRSSSWPVQPMRMDEGREWLAGLERPGVSLDIMGNSIYLTMLSTVVWPRMFRACSGVVYVMPAHPPHSAKLAQSRDELHRLVNVQCDTPVLIVVTDKGDATGTLNASSSVEIAEYFGLYALQRLWRVQMVDLNTFNGVLEGFKWLCYAMKM